MSCLNQSAPTFDDTLRVNRAGVEFCLLGSKKIQKVEDATFRCGLGNNKIINRMVGPSSTA